MEEENQVSPDNLEDLEFHVPLADVNPYQNIVFMHKITEQEDEDDSEFNRSTSMIKVTRFSDGSLSNHMSVGKLRNKSQSVTKDEPFQVNSQVSENI